MSVLNDLVLILNKNWEAIRIRNVKDAIRLISRERACFVDHSNWSVYTWLEWINLEVEPGEKFISTVSFNIRVPEIIILTKYNKVPEYDVKLTKRNVFIRDRYNCQYTGDKVHPKNADIDHVVPKSKGGKTTWDNLVVTSKKLNRKKGNKSLKESGLKLVKKPIKPSYRSILFDPRKEIKESWKKFIKIK